MADGGDGYCTPWTCIVLYIFNEGLTQSDWPMSWWYMVSIRLAMGSAMQIILPWYQNRARELKETEGGFDISEMSAVEKSFLQVLPHYI